MIKRTILFCAALAALSLCADDNPYYISYDGQTVFGQQQPSYLATINEDGTTNVWTYADLVDALQLLNRKYHRELATPEGRKAWHGTVKSVVQDEKSCTKQTIYEDGYVHTEKWVRRPTQRELDIKAAKARQQVKERKLANALKDVPAAVAEIKAARIEQEFSDTVEQVTIDIGEAK